MQSLTAVAQMLFFIDADYWIVALESIVDYATVGFKIVIPQCEQACRAVA